MAFAGAYFSKIKKIVYGSENIGTAESSQPSPNSGSYEGNESENSNHYTESAYPGILDSELTSLTIAQRNIFIVTLMTFFVLSMCGNLCTLFVNFRRKIRPFFRVCLISLALSDILNTVFITTAYLSQFTAEYVQVWLASLKNVNFTGDTFLKSVYILISPLAIATNLYCFSTFLNWQRLGSLMCNLVPFATTAAILASSMTLVGIAVDRYYAVMKAVNGFWNPSVLSCGVCMLCIWLASAGISCPVFSIYDIQPVYILTEEHEDAKSTVWSTTADSLSEEVASSEIKTKTPWEIEASLENLSYTLVRVEKLVDMCISDQKDVTLYYVIVFVIIFIPCIGAFFWFNSVIARKLWKRRHNVAVSRTKSPKASKFKNRTKSNLTSNNIELQNPQKPITIQQTKSVTLQPRICNCRFGHSSSSTLPSSLANTMGGNKTTIGATCSTSNTAATTTTSVNTNSSREARHLRMFTIILLMMAVFVFLRLPAWIFLLMRMYGSYTKPIHWILYFVFGIMNLASSLLNPLFYTFLTETIQYVLRFKAKLTSVICGDCSRTCCCHQYGRYGSKSNASNSPTKPPRAYGRCQSPVIMDSVNEPLHTCKCWDNFCGCSYFSRAPWKCYQPNMETGYQQQTHPHALQDKNEICSKDSGQALNNEKDEGVDCSDEVDDEDVDDFYEYNDRIYTIFPPSLVSSSINSQ